MKDASSKNKINPESDAVTLDAGEEGKDIWFSAEQLRSHMLNFDINQDLVSKGLGSPTTKGSINTPT